MKDHLLRAAPVVFVLLWATGFIGARMGMPYAEPGTFLAIRFALAFVLLAALAAALRAKWPGFALAWRCVAIGALLHGVYLGGVFWAVHRGMPAGVVAVIVGLQPLLTAALAGVWLGERVTRRHAIGLAAGFAGVVLVLAPKIDVAGAGITGATVAAAVLGAIAVTIGTVWQKRLGASVDLRSGTALQYAGGVVPVLLLALTTETGTVQWTGELVFAFVWLVFVLSIGAVFLLMWLIREGSVARVSTLFFLVPGVAATLAWALFGETLSPVQLAGMALTASAVALANRRAPLTA
ncbi:EamA family transporter [Rhizobiaceae bacterium]|nr:EamA family transporter [Rhizobiaceae bacterium]